MLSMAGNDNGLHFWGAGQFFQGIGQLNAHRLIKRIVFFRSGQRDDRNAILYVDDDGWAAHGVTARSEEHTSELQSLMRISYAVFCLKKKKSYNYINTNTNIIKKYIY